VRALSAPANEAWGANAVSPVRALAFASFAVARLLSHQPPQTATDRAAGKRSFAVRYGWTLHDKVVQRGLVLRSASEK
jgi:hypothetical protein